MYIVVRSAMAVVKALFWVSATSVVFALTMTYAVAVTISGTKCTPSMMHGLSRPPKFTYHMSPKFIVALVSRVMGVVRALSREASVTSVQSAQTTTSAQNATVIIKMCIHSTTPGNCQIFIATGVGKQVSSRVSVISA